MTIFNPEGKDVLTYGEALRPAMEITEQSDADQYLADYAAFVQKDLNENPRTDGLDAVTICRANLGYYAGYYDKETMQRINRLFNCSHPIFGGKTK